MNKLEAQYLRILQARYPAAKILAQAVTVKLGNGCRFCPDLFSFNFKQAWEIKGRYAWDDSIVKLKVAATMLPEITWVLCWKQDGRWQEQIVLPLFQAPYRLTISIGRQYHHGHHHQTAGQKEDAHSIG